MKKAIFLIALFITALFLTWNVYSQENAFDNTALQHRNAFDFDRDEKISKEEYYSNKALPILRFYF